MIDIKIYNRLEILQHNTRSSIRPERGSVVCGIS